MRELIKVNGHFKAIDSIKQFLKSGAQVGGTFFEGFLAVKDFASNSSARFGGPAQRSFVEGGGFHHCIEGFGVVPLPSFVARLNLDFATLSAILSIFVFAPEYIVCNCFEFVLCERGTQEFGSLDVGVNKVTAVLGPVY